MKGKPLVIFPYSLSSAPHPLLPLLVVPPEPPIVPASIPLEVAFEQVRPKYTPPPNSPHFDEHVVGQALKLMSASCQFCDQFHFEAHLNSTIESSPQH